MHVFDLCVIPLELAQDHLFVLPVAELGLDLVEVARDFRQSVSVRLLRASLL